MKWNECKDVAEIQMTLNKVQWFGVVYKKEYVLHRKSNKGIHTCATDTSTEIIAFKVYCHLVQKDK